MKKILFILFFFPLSLMAEDVEVIVTPVICPISTDICEASTTIMPTAGLGGANVLVVGAFWPVYDVVKSAENQSDNDSKGDINGDQKVNISDVTALVNIILGKDSDSTMSDVNGDGKVNISDVTALVNMILGK